MTSCGVQNAGGIGVLTIDIILNPIGTESDVIGLRSYFGKVCIFDNSIEKTIAALLNVSDTALSDEESNRLAALIEQAKKEEDEQC